MYVIVSVLLFSLTYARNCRTVTNRCPTDEVKWKSRAQQFDCLNKNGKYTCLKDNENNLVETCVETVLIRKGVVGCPYILLCKNNLGLIGLDEDFHDCPTNKTGCPPKNHTGYALHEMYKYPACSTFDSTKATEENINIQDKESSPSKIPWIPIVIPLISIVTVVSVSLGIIFYLRRKQVKCRCCGRTKQSEDVELGTKTSLLGGDEAKVDEPDDQELKGETIQSDIQQFGNEMKDAIESQDSERIMEKLNTWKKEPVQIGIAGPSGAGKSSFINTMLGIKSTKNVAKTGLLGDTTLKPTEYHSPKSDGLKFWDLPGYGTSTFKLNETYLKNMNVQHYDFLLIFYLFTISEMDITFAKHLLRMGKKFAMVRTRADEFNTSNIEQQSFDQLVGSTKEKCRSCLNKEGITEEVPIFVISNKTPRLGDFDDLINYLTNNTPEIKRMNIFVTFKRQTSEMINNKESQLLDRAWKAAVAMGISASLPIPGIDIAFNMALLDTEIKSYLEAFQLDEESLKEHPEHNIKQLKTCRKIMKVGRHKFIIENIKTFAVISTIGSAFEFSIPILGGFINGTASTYCMYNFLKSLITNLAEDARTMRKLQSDSFI